MMRRSPVSGTPLPEEFLEWQVALRHWTMEARDGTPHVGVAPTLVVRRPGVGPGVTSHSIVCGLLPHPTLLEARTASFRGVYEAGIERGARAVYDAGIAYLRGYYRSIDDFDATTITTLLPGDSPAVAALRADHRCALVFHVFEAAEGSEGGGMRCLQVNVRAEILAKGPVYDNVWWHNAVFHGPVDDHVVIRFHHESTYDTRFGGLERLAG